MVEWLPFITNFLFVNFTKFPFEVSIRSFEFKSSMFFIPPLTLISVQGLRQGILFTSQVKWTIPEPPLPPPPEFAEPEPPPPPPLPVFGVPFAPSVVLKFPLAPSPPYPYVSKTPVKSEVTPTPPAPSVPTTPLEPGPPAPPPPPPEPPTADDPLPPPSPPFGSATSEL